MDELLQSTTKGLFCVPGNFFIDPHSPVPRAVVTHAHTDHACWGCQHYLAAQPSEHLLRLRMDEASEFQFLPYRESITLGGVRVSFHPAGHILGSAQVRLEYRGKIALITGDYKLGSDPTCEAWEPVKCHLMITESTFGLPVYRWQPQETIVESINQWWRESRDAEKCCLLYAYAVGKASERQTGYRTEVDGRAHAFIERIE